MSIGDQYLNSVKNEQDERNSQMSGPSSQGRSPKIFNKQRAMQASQKFSVMSEGGQHQKHGLF